MTFQSRTQSILLDGRWWLYSTFLTLQSTKRREESGTLRDLDPGIQEDIESSRFQQSMHWLQSRLQNTPFWARGHWELAKISFAAKQYRLAYASCLASEKLGLAGVEKERKFLLAKCYLRNGQSDKSLQVLEGLIDDYGELAEFIEEKAACLLAVGKRDQAEVLLSQVPEEARSPEAQAALQYCQRAKT